MLVGACSRPPDTSAPRAPRHTAPRVVPLTAHTPTPPAPIRIRIRVHPLRPASLRSILATAQQKTTPRTSKTTPRDPLSLAAQDNGDPEAGREEGVQEGGSSRSAKAGLIFPVGRVGSMLRRGQYARRIGASGAVYMAAVLEYLTAELLELSVKAASQQTKKTKRLTPRTVTLAVRHDDDLGALLRNVTLSRGGVMPSLNRALAKKQKSPKQARGTPSA
ncbi:putative C terminus of histone H2A [Trypanosoma vivax]|nr:putative C terminus of histone H2A [Trypanosoma vivax]